MTLVDVPSIIHPSSHMPGEAVFIILCVCVRYGCWTDRHKVRMSKKKKARQKITCSTVLLSRSLLSSVNIKKTSSLLVLALFLFVLPHPSHSLFSHPSPPLKQKCAPHCSWLLPPSSSPPSPPTRVPMTPPPAALPPPPPSAWPPPRTPPAPLSSSPTPP